MVNRTGYLDDQLPTLVDVTLAEARAIECNRCGDCCNGLREGVLKDEATGMPRFTWGREFPTDLYERRYGQRMLVPIVLGDGGPDFGEAFEVFEDGPYTAFACSFLDEAPGDGCATACRLKRDYPDPDPARLEQIRPRNCGEFPVFGGAVDSTIIGGSPFTPPVGALPNCAWYGLRVVGPWKDTPYWRDRWARQQRGEEVEDMSPPDNIDEFMAGLLSRRATVDGSVPKEEIGAR